MKEFDRYRDGSGKTHKEMFERLSALEQARASMETMLESMDGKLDKLVSWREMQDDKPNKLLDKLKESSIWLVLAAVIGVVLGRLGCERAAGQGPGGLQGGERAMRLLIAAVSALVVGIALGIVFSAATIRHLSKRVKELRSGRERPSLLRSVTRFFFVTTQFFALAWVCTSYGIAIYSTVWLEQVYTMSELSEPAIQTILGVGFLKVMENIFEHNEGKLFGRSRAERAAEDQVPPGMG